MKKLELKHLCAYLPYKVEYMHNGSISRLGSYHLPLVVKSIDRGDDFKLILRPMSDLTKPCLEGGKVPIVKLAKTLYPDQCWILDDKYALDLKCNSILGFNRQYNLFEIDQSANCIDQLSLLNWLFEHHFDIYNLIDIGLAIDINSLN